MEHCFLPRSIWNNESKFVQHAPDLYTSVVVTRNILTGTSFGPCVLQNTFYDTIAFIALKSSDKRNKAYIFRVDPEAMRSSVLVFSWLRLVQAARNREEQNTEAYLNAGQLYIRTTRDIRPEEELLVWYDQELSHLLGFTDMRGSTSNEFKCVKCNQVFKNEHPFLAHCRFLCTQLRNDTLSCEAYEQKPFEIKRKHRVTDFHNLARDLEHATSITEDDAEMSLRKRKYYDTGFMRARKTVLLEKTNISNDNNITQLNCVQHLTLGTSVSILKPKADNKNQSKREHLEYKSIAPPQSGEVNANFTHSTERKKEINREKRMGEDSGLRSNNPNNATSGYSE
ncbi:zinc finger protein 488 [Aplochiton taeniatus]